MRLLNLARPLTLTLFVFFFSSATLNAQQPDAIAAVQCVQASAPKFINRGTLVEEFTFLIQDFKINHQSEINNLNIKLRYCYETGIVMSQYPDFTDILKDIQGFLNNYPNETDYWEILNKKLTQRVLRKYPVLSSITSEMQVSPSAMIPYTRSTIVTRYQSK
jgi:hypothetical protein